MSKSKLKKPASTAVEFKNIGKDSSGYFVGYLKGKRKKYVEQKERYPTREAAMAALGLTPAA
jgi:hypothetical protein